MSKNKSLKLNHVLRQQWNENGNNKKIRERMNPLTRRLLSSLFYIISFARKWFSFVVKERAPHTNNNIWDMCEFFDIFHFFICLYPQFCHGYFPFFSSHVTFHNIYTPHESQRKRIKIILKKSLWEWGRMWKCENFKLQRISFRLFWKILFLFPYIT